MDFSAAPPVNSTEFCDWRVQSQGNCEGVTYVSFLYTTHIISSFLFLFISIGILIHNIWWKGQKIWEFSRNDRAFRPRPTEGFVLWCAGYFFCTVNSLLSPFLSSLSLVYYVLMFLHWSILTDPFPYCFYTCYSPLCAFCFITGRCQRRKTWIPRKLCKLLSVIVSIAKDYANACILFCCKTNASLPHLAYPCTDNQNIFFRPTCHGYSSLVLWASTWSASSTRPQHHSRLPPRNVVPHMNSNRLQRSPTTRTPVDSIP